MRCELRSPLHHMLRCSPSHVLRHFLYDVLCGSLHHVFDSHLLPLIVPSGPPVPRREDFVSFPLLPLSLFRSGSPDVALSLLSMIALPLTAAELFRRGGRWLGGAVFLGSPLFLTPLWNHQYRTGVYEGAESFPGSNSPES